DSHVDAMAQAAAKVVRDYKLVNPTADAAFQRQERLVSAAAERPATRAACCWRAGPISTGAR
ncbi:MAG: hypothetical protein VKP63_06855, partial [Cyanobacteriota bacterium]|nr:hypothetical protein [Cyanobacteriota bacterium]